MFTGIVEEVGSVVDVGPSAAGVTALRIACDVVVADARVGDSISVNGCCLTVTALHDGAEGSGGSGQRAQGAHVRTTGPGGSGQRAQGAQVRSPGPRGFSTEMMGETLNRTALGRLRAGDPTNLEPAMRADGRFGGHVVQGHVDAVAQVLAVEPQEAWTVLRVSLPEPLGRYVVEKGSITVDGTSLTVMAVDERSFSVGLIPHTLSATVLGMRRAGDAVNLEADVIAKYVERQVQAYATAPGESRATEQRPIPEGSRE